MEVALKYANWEERQHLVKEWEGGGYRMLHDDFDPDWKLGDEPHGVMTFTTEEPPESSPLPMSELELRVGILEIKVDKLEKATVK